MMVLTRYLAREIIGATLMVTLAFLGLFVFFDFVNELDNVGRGGFEVSHALIYVLLLLPGRLYELIPITTLIGTLYALTNLGRHSELTVMRASGMSIRRMLFSLCLSGLVFVVLTFVVGEYVAPPSERAAQQYRLTATGSSVSQALSSGLWVRDGVRFVNVRTMRPDRTMVGVRLYEFDADRRLASLSVANVGHFDMERGGWVLQGVNRTVFGESEMRREHLEEILWQSDLTPEVLSVLMVEPERMSVPTLYAYIEHLKDNQQNADRYEIALWKKLTYPLASLVMIVLALPFSLSLDRMGGVSVKVFLGVMLGVGFYMLNGLFSNLGTINAWPPALAAITPSLLFLLLAMGMLYWVERR